MRRFLLATSLLWLIGCGSAQPPAVQPAANQPPVVQVPTVQRSPPTPPTELIGDSNPPAATERPEAPKGFRWQELTAINGAALVPDGWFFRETEKAGTFIYQITKEETDDEKQFDTGLTINVVRDVRAKTELSPVHHALRYIGTYSKGAEMVVQPDIAEAGPFQRVFCEIRKQYPETGEKKFRVRMEMLANESSGTLYVMLFGAPDDEWETAWHTGKTLFSPLVLPP